jgi:hypothetical protein
VAQFSNSISRALSFSALFGNSGNWKSLLSAEPICDNIFRNESKHPPAKPVALACEPLKAARKAFSESASASVSQSEVAIGF